MSEMPWNEAYEAIEPYVVRIATVSSPQSETVQQENFLAQ